MHTSYPKIGTAPPDPCSIAIKETEGEVGGCTSKRNRAALLTSTDQTEGRQTILPGLASALISSENRCTDDCLRDIIIFITFRLRVQKTLLKPLSRAT